MVDVGFSHVLDEGNLTPTQEKCLDRPLPFLAFDLLSEEVLTH